MSSALGSVTCWLDLLKAGRQTAAQELWERYFRALVRLARQKMRDLPRRAADEEDVALSAFASFCRAAAHDRLPRLDDRHDLWQVLATVTARKVIALRRREYRAKRGGGAAMAEAAPDNEGGIDGILGLVVGREPTPAFAALMAEEYHRLLDVLHDERLQRVAVAKMEGYTTTEIAGELKCTTRTIERKLRTIRKLWGQESSP